MTQRFVHLTVAGLLEGNPYSLPLIDGVDENHQLNDETHHINLQVVHQNYV